MALIDDLYQNAVDAETEKVLKLSVDEFLNIDNYGAIDVTINGEKKSIGWWHYKFEENLHHLHFVVQRRVCFFLYKKCLSGVKLCDGKILS